MYLERTAAYEQREGKRTGGQGTSGKGHIPGSRKTDGDAENSGIEQFLKRKFHIEFLNNL